MPCVGKRQFFETEQTVQSHASHTKDGPSTEPDPHHKGTSFEAPWCIGSSTYSAQARTRMVMGAAHAWCTRPRTPIASAQGLRCSDAGTSQPRNHQPRTRQRPAAFENAASTQKFVHEAATGAIAQPPNLPKTGNRKAESPAHRPRQESSSCRIKKVFMSAYNICPHKSFLNLKNKIKPCALL